MKGRRRIPCLLATCLAFLLVAVPLASAQTTGSILGTVTDETEGVLPGATVTVKHVDTGVTREVITETDGRYRATALNIGAYDVSVSLQGFQPVVRTGIMLTIGRDAVVDFALSLGTMTESVEVTGDAPLVDTQSGRLGAIVSRETILEIPLNGRDLTQLIGLQAGASTAANVGTDVNRGFGQRFSIGGSRVTDNAILMDGTEVKGMDGGLPSGVSGNMMGGEAIQEFRIERNSYSAEFGGASGGVINVVTKSGGNAFHGSGYGFMRNDALDATNFRAANKFDAAGNVIGKEKPDFSRAQYGASAGGRILENRTFYFGNYEALRERLGSSPFVQTFTAAARQGILPGRTVTVNPAMVPYLALWPLPPATSTDLGDGTARYQRDEQRPTDEYYVQIRVDHNLSASDSVFGRLTRQKSSVDDASAIDRWYTTSESYGTFSTVEWKKVISSRLLNTARFGYNLRGLSAYAHEDPPVDASLLFVPADKWRKPLGSVQILGSLGVPGVSGVGLGRGWVDRYTTRFQVQDGLVYARGAHTLKAGGDWQIIRMDGENPSRVGGELSFASIDAFLRGQPRSCRCEFIKGAGDNIRHLKWHQVAWYVQEDWQVNSRLTVNAGVRHEFYTIPTERDGEISNLKNPLTDPTYTVLGTRGDTWWKNPSFKNFSPRVGFAWDPDGSGKMAIRGGGGVFQNLLSPETPSQLLWRNAPFAIESNVQQTEGTIPFPAGLFDYIVGLGSAAGDLFVMPYDNAGNPRMAQWNLNVQREVLPHTTVTAGYSGSQGMELAASVNLNTARAELVNGRYVFPATATSPNPAFVSRLTSPQNYGKSWYHAFQLEVQRRFNAGWQMQLAYTRARAIDLASSIVGGSIGNGAGGATPYVYDVNLGKGLAAHDIRQRFTGSAIWRLPQVGSGITDAVLGGWQLGGILTLSDGSPINVSIGTPTALSALGLAPPEAAAKPDLIAGGNSNPVLGDPDKYFDVTQFVFPPSRTIGNLGRNNLIGPGLIQVDLGLTKNFTFATSRRIQLKVDVFNLLNRANLGSPSNQVFNASGQRVGGAAFISSTAGSARQVQLGARFDW